MSSGYKRSAGARVRRFSPSALIAILAVTAIVIAAVALPIRRITGVAAATPVNTAVPSARVSAPLTPVTAGVPGPPPLHDSRDLWVCADPNNMPFSNAKGEGFENQIAALVADDLGRD